MRSGVVLAGGRSTRFGERDKAVADLAGTPMSRRVADRLTDVVDELVVNCRPDQTEAIRAAMSGYPLEVAYAEDDVPDLGPVAGIRNGLEGVSGTSAFVVACDMPFVDPALVSFLFKRLDETEADAVVPRLESGWFQTTQAVYRVEPMIRACEIALETDNPRILAPLDELDVAVVEEAELTDVTTLESFENINTREEFERAARRLNATD